MSKLVKTITMNGVPGKSSDRVVQKVSALDAVEKTEVMPSLRRWIEAGFELDDIGHGIMESLLAFSGTKQWQTMSRKRKSEILKHIIDRTIWLEDELPVSEHVQPRNRGSKPMPEQEPEPMAVTTPIIERVKLNESGSVAGMPKGFQLADI